MNTSTNPNVRSCECCGKLADDLRILKMSLGPEELLVCKAHAEAHDRLNEGWYPLLEWNFVQLKRIH